MKMPEILVKRAQALEDYTRFIIMGWHRLQPSAF